MKFLLTAAVIFLVYKFFFLKEKGISKNDSTFDSDYTEYEEVDNESKRKS